MFGPFGDDAVLSSIALSAMVTGASEIEGKPPGTRWVVAGTQETLEQLRGYAKEIHEAVDNNAEFSDIVNSSSGPAVKGRTLKPGAPIDAAVYSFVASEKPGIVMVYDDDTLVSVAMDLDTGDVAAVKARTRDELYKVGRMMQQMARGLPEIDMNELKKLTDDIGQYISGGLFAPLGDAEFVATAREAAESLTKLYSSLRGNDAGYECPKCGVPLEKELLTVKYVNGEQIPVYGDVLICPKCGYALGETEQEESANGALKVRATLKMEIDGSHHTFTVNTEMVRDNLTDAKSVERWYTNVAKEIVHEILDAVSLEAIENDAGALFSLRGRIVTEDGTVVEDGDAEDDDAYLAVAVGKLLALRMMERRGLDRDYIVTSTEEEFAEQLPGFIYRKFNPVEKRVTEEVASEWARRILEMGEREAQIVMVLDDGTIDYTRVFKYDPGNDDAILSMLDNMKSIVLSKGAEPLALLSRPDEQNRSVFIPLSHLSIEIDGNENGWLATCKHN